MFPCCHLQRIALCAQLPVSRSAVVCLVVLQVPIMVRLLVLPLVLRRLVRVPIKMRLMVRIQMIMSPGLLLGAPQLPVPLVTIMLNVLAAVRGVLLLQPLIVLLLAL